MPIDMMDLISRLLDVEERRREEEGTGVPEEPVEPPETPEVPGISYFVSPDEGRIPYPPEVAPIPDMPTQAEYLDYLSGTIGRPTEPSGQAAVTKPTVEEMITAGPAPAQAAAAATEGKSWEQRFFEAHGRQPNQKDRMDREWSEQHAGLHGRPPTEDEWKWNYFNPNPDLIKKYFPSAAGGGGYSMQPQLQPGEEIPEPLGELAWWGPDVTPPLLRPWATWFQELVEMNRLMPIAFPFDRDEAAEVVADQELIETGEEFAVPGYTSTRGILDRLQGLLGLEFEEGVEPTEKWQSLITAIPTAGFEAQQLLASLRYSPEQAWYAVDIGQLVRPEYL